MVGLLALLIIVGAAVWWFSTKDDRERSKLDQVMERSVVAGILSPDQARQVVALQVPEPEKAADRIPLAAEAVGYVGGILLIAGGALVMSRVWENLAVAVQLGFLAILAAVLIGAGALVREATDPAFARLRAFLWLLGAGAVAGLAGLAVNELATGEEAGHVALAAGLAGGATSGALWALRDRPVQHLGAFVGLAVGVGTGMALLAEEGLTGLALAVFAAAWLLAGRREWLPPALLAMLLGGAGLVIGLGVAAVQWPAAVGIFGVAVAVVLLTAGTRLDESVLVGTGALCAVVFVSELAAYFEAPYLLVIAAVIALVAAVTLREPVALGLGLLGLAVGVPATVFEYFGENVGAPLAMVAVGGALLGGVIWALRRQAHHDGHGGMSGLPGGGAAGPHPTPA